MNIYSIDSMSVNIFGVELLTLMGNRLSGYLKSEGVTSNSILSQSILALPIVSIDRPIVYGINKFIV